MDESLSEPFLSAAQCASQTGLTVRALHVYEQCGLISPVRTAAGWRQYGPGDLIRLNTIGVLKAAGLSLSQIRDAIQSGATVPTLEQVLQIQLGAWSARITDAIRGKSIVEEALKRLGNAEALSIDELCGLIRSLEMSTKVPDGESPQGPDMHAGAPAALDRCSGFYQIGDFGLWHVVCEGSKLLVHTGQAGTPLELTPTGEDEFELGGSGKMLRLSRDEHGAVVGLVIYAQGTTISAKRVDTARAEEVKANLAARIQFQKPLPGSEDALRRLIAGFMLNDPIYAEMTPALAHVSRTQLPQLRALASYFGEVQSIKFQGVGSQGWDVYDVEREHGSERYRIMLESDGKISGASVVPLNAPVSLGP